MGTCPILGTVATREGCVSRDVIYALTLVDTEIQWFCWKVFAALNANVSGGMLARVSCKERMVGISHLFIGFRAVALMFLVVLDASRSVQAYVLVVTTYFQCVLTFQANKAIGADAVLKEIFIERLVQVTDVLDCLLKISQVFGSFGTNSVILALQVARAVVCIIVFVVVAIVRSNVVLRVLTFIKR
jgi:hypothetical protein